MEEEATELLSNSSVHDALQGAVFEMALGWIKGDKVHRMENLTVRMDPEKKVVLKKICDTVNISPSDFFRVCADQLIRDYMGPRAFLQLVTEVIARDQEFARQAQQSPA